MNHIHKKGNKGFFFKKVWNTEQNKVINKVYTFTITGKVSSLSKYWTPELKQTNFTASKISLSIMVSRSGSFMVKVFSPLHFRNWIQGGFHPDLIRYQSNGLGAQINCFKKSDQKMFWNMISSFLVMIIVHISETNTE